MEAGQPAPAVVGAGYAGLMVARFFTQAGCPPTIYEEHGRVGFPKHCTGIVSTPTLLALGEPGSQCLDHSYTRIIVEGSKPPGFMVEVAGIAHMLDRVCLEKRLLQQAITHGAEFAPHTRVTRVEQGPSGVRLQAQATAKEGPPTRLTRTHTHAILAIGAKPPHIHHLTRQERRPPIPGVNFLITADHGVEPDTIRVFFDHSLAPGFFAWAVPRGRDSIVVGLASDSPQALRRGLDRIAREKLGLNRYEATEAYGGPVNRGPPLARLVEGRVMLAGDTGLLVKPVTGGGLYPMAKATQNPPLVGGCEQAYITLSRRVKVMAGELRRQYRIARILHDPSNQDLIDRAVEIAREESLGELIGGRAGFDGHHLLARAVLRKPKAALRLALAAGWRALGLLF